LGEICKNESCAVRAPVQQPLRPQPMAVADHGASFQPIQGTFWAAHFEGIPTHFHTSGQWCAVQAHCIEYNCWNGQRRETGGNGDQHPHYGSGRTICLPPGLPRELYNIYKPYILNKRNLHALWVPTPCTTCNFQTQFLLPLGIQINQ
jgi:hypothetical protein